MTETILKENLWNKLFHKNHIKKQREVYKDSMNIMGLYNYFIDEIDKAKTLVDLLDIHKKAWKYGFRNYNLGPCSSGMFRCTDINSMTVDQVYLGNIYGLRTANIRFWNQNANEDMSCNGFGIPDDTKIITLILKQYKRHLESNIMSIYNEAEHFTKEYSKINLKK